MYRYKDWLLMSSTSLQLVSYVKAVINKGPIRLAFD